jgi:DNA-binding MarR family transcriptional regulator
VDYIDQLARLRLSRQQAAILTELYRLGPAEIHPWQVKPGSRTESASTSRAIHRLKERGYIKLLALPGRQRFSHLTLTDEGRSLAAIIAATIL